VKVFVRRKLGIGLQKRTEPARGNGLQIRIQQIGSFHTRSLNHVSLNHVFDHRLPHGCLSIGK
jgi:hypothetical protein